MPADWSLQRIESLSDGVFAVAMTLLLVMERAVPRSISDIGAHPIFGDVLQLLPIFAASPPASSSRPCFGLATTGSFARLFAPTSFLFG